MILRHKNKNVSLKNSIILSSLPILFSGIIYQFVAKTSMADALKKKITHIETINSIHK